MSKINEATLKQARNSGVLNLTGRELTDIPAVVWDLDEENFDKRHYELEKIQKLILDNNQLRQLSPDICKLKKIKSVSLNDNELAGLPNEIFMLKMMKSFSATNNHLAALPDSIERAMELSLVDVSHNRLETLPKFPMDILLVNASHNQLVVINPMHYEKLTELKLNNNKLSSLPAGLFEYLPSLQALDLSRNQLRSLEGVGHSKSILECNLVGNRLTSLGDAFIESSNLHTLIVSENPLVSLPFESELTSLTTLQASSCKLTVLDAKVANFKSLKSLDVSSNELKTIPPELGTIASLVAVNATGNLIKTIPRTTVDNPKLLAEYLKERSSDGGQKGSGGQGNVSDRWDLRKKKLTAMPALPANAKDVVAIDAAWNLLESTGDLTAFAKLRTLIYASNKLTAVDPSLRTLPNLTSLDVSANQLKNCDLILSLENLHELDLSRNPTLAVGAIPFGQLPRLHTLKLSGLKLTSVPDSVLQVSTLRILSLEGNGLQAIDGAAIAGALEKLEELDLSNNNISRLPAELSRLPLRSIGWEGNPLVAPNRTVCARGTPAIMAYLAGK